MERSSQSDLKMVEMTGKEGGFGFNASNKPREEARSPLLAES